MSGHVQGTACRLYYNVGSFGSPSYGSLDGEFTSDLNWSMSPIDTTDKDSGNYSESIAGIRNWSVSATGHVDEGTAVWDKIVDDCLTSTQVLTKLEYSQVDSVKYSGSCWGTDFSISAPHDAAVDVALTLTGTGALTQSAA